MTGKMTTLGLHTVFSHAHTGQIVSNDISGLTLKDSKLTLTNMVDTPKKVSRLRGKKITLFCKK